VTRESQTGTGGAPGSGSLAGYCLDHQVGFLLRRANQRHLAIFARAMPSLTPRQFAALARLGERGPLSQNQLGRETAMDAATIKGVVVRLAERGLAETGAHPNDRRRVMISLTDIGARVFESQVQTATEITKETLAPLTADERSSFLRMLEKIC